MEALAEYDHLDTEEQREGQECQAEQERGKSKQDSTAARTFRITWEQNIDSTLLELYSLAPDRPNVMIFRIFFMPDSSTFSGALFA